MEFRELSKSRLSDIDEPMIERFKLLVKDSSKTTVTLPCHSAQGPALCSRKLKLIDKTPVIEMYKHDKDNTVDASVNTSTARLTIRHGSLPPASPTLCVDSRAWRRDLPG
jgi:hypothetical protein